MKLNKKYKFLSILTIFIILLVSISGFVILPNQIEASGPTEVDKIISINTTWTKTNSPYIVKNNVLVEKGITLTINPGVKIRFNGYYFIQVEGKLIAIGNKNNMISFSSNKKIPKTGDWDSIKFFNNPGNQSILKFCKIEHASFAIQSYSYPIIQNNFFNNSELAIYHSTEISHHVQDNDYTLINASYQISNNTIINCRYTPIYIHLYIHGYDARTKRFNLLITNNTISNNWVKALDSFAMVYDGAGLFCDVIGVNTTIVDNIFSKNNGTGIWCRPEGNKIIANNLIINNSRGIQLPIPIDDYDLTLKNNTIVSNEVGIVLWTDRPMVNSTICNNNIFNNTLYNVKNEVAKNRGNWNLKNNWWGTTNTTIIDNKIYDYYDDFNVGKINYKPFLNKSNVNAPVIIEIKPSGEYFNNEDNPQKKNNTDDENGKRWIFSSGFEIAAISVSSLSIIIIISTFFIKTEIGKYGFYSAFVPLYMKRRKKRKLSYIKGSVRGYILGNPGERYNDIKKVLKLPNGTLTYYLNVLEKEGIIRSERDGFNKRFYPTQGKTVGDIIELTEIQQTIRWVINNNPGISQKDIQSQLGISQQKLNYHIQLMENARILRLEKEGNKSKCYVIEEAS